MALKDKLMTLEDFKAVRDVDVASNSAQFTEIKADLGAYQTVEPIEDWEAGSFDNSGSRSTVAGRIRTTVFISKSTGCVSISANTGYEFFVAAWDNEGVFVGVLRTDGTFKTSGTILYVTNFNLLSYVEDYSYKIVMRRTDSTDITLEESDNALFSYSIPRKNSDKIDKLDAGVNNIASNLGVETDLTSTVTLTNGKGVYYRYNGQLSNSTVSSYTSFVDVREYDKIRFTRKRLISSSSYGCAFYREAQTNLEGNLVTGYREPYGETETTAETVEMAIPEGANYFRTTWFASTLDLYDQYEFSLIGIKTGALEKRIEDTETDIETLKEACLPDIADKYTAEMADTISKVRDLCTEPCLVFPWSTDNHILSANADAQNYADMVRNMRAFAQDVPCDFVLDTGDLTDGNVAKATTLTRAYEAIEKIRLVGVPFVWAQGNHDTNYASSTFTMEECFKAYFTATGKSAVLNKAENGTDYYIDFESIGVRLIVLNANNVTDYAEYAYGSTTATWLTSALGTQSDVIVAVHQSPISSQVYGNQSTRLATGIVTALTDFVENGGNLMMLSGHSHNDVAFVSPFVSIMQDCQRFSIVSTDVTDDAHDMTGYIDVVRKNSRSTSDHTTDLWSVVVYKAISKELDLIRFGAGKDRYFHIEPIAPTTVASKLTGVTWSTSDATVATVSEGVITDVGTGRCAILAKDADGNYECWIVEVN